MRYLIPAALAAFLLAGCDGAREPTPPATAPTAARPVPTLAELPAPYSAASLQDGERHFAKCRACHSTRAAEGHLVGPNLHGVFERHPGTAPKFRYSEALKAVPFEAWTPDLIDQWLARPKDFIPNTAMFFNGIDKADERRDLIAWLLIQTRS